MEQTYSVKDLARILRKNPETVRRWIREGKINATRITLDYKAISRSHWIITQKELDRLLGR